MNLGVRVAVVGAGALAAACALSSCAGSPTADQKKAVRNIHTTTTTTTAPTTSTTSSTTSSTTTTTSTTTTQPGLTVPNVIGLKIRAARATLRAAGLFPVALNAACNKGTPASQSVVISLSLPGKASDPRAGAVPLAPGAIVPPGTRVGITWSGCYVDRSPVPGVVGLSFASARHALHAVGLTWACYSVDSATTTAPASSTAPAVTTTTVKPSQVVLTQSPGPGTVLNPGATVTLTMPTCPQ